MCGPTTVANQDPLGHACDAVGEASGRRTVDQGRPVGFTAFAKYEKLDLRKLGLPMPLGLVRKWIIEEQCGATVGCQLTRKWMVEEGMGWRAGGVGT